MIDRRTGSRPGGGRWRCIAGAGLMALATAAGGCTATSEMLGEKPAASSRVALPPGSVQELEFPNLSTVPTAVPATTSAEERQALIQELAADRAQAEYQGVGQPSAAGN